MKRLLKMTLTLSLIMTTSLLLSACGTQKNQQTTAQKEQRVLTDGRGEKISVPNQPKRIIASYLEDYLVALGITPVAQWTVNDASIQDYLQDKLKGIPTIDFSLPFEDVLAFNPDLLIIGDSALVEGGKDKQYAQIAPTYVLNSSKNITWRGQLKEIAKVVNQQEKAQTMLKEYDQHAKKMQAKLKQQGHLPSVAVLWVVNNQLFIVHQERSSGAVLYGDLGLQVPALITQISQKGQADWNPVSLEKLAELETDALFLINSDQDAPLFKEAIWQNLPAVKQNRVYSFGPETSWLYNGPIANRNIIDDAVKALLSE